VAEPAQMTGMVMDCRYAIATAGLLSLHLCRLFQARLTPADVDQQGRERRAIKRRPKRLRFPQSFDRPWRPEAAGRHLDRHSTRSSISTKRSATVADITAARRLGELRRRVEQGMVAPSPGASKKKTPTLVQIND